MVQGSGFRVEGLGLGFRVRGLEFTEEGELDRRHGKAVEHEDQRQLPTSPHCQTASPFSSAWICTTAAPDSGEVQYKSRALKKWI